MQVPMEIFNLNLSHFTSLILLLLLLSSSPSSSSTTDPLSDALLTFKSHLTDPSNSLTNWAVSISISPSQLPQTIQACSWTGITCTTTQNSTKLTSINLSNHNLSGSITHFHLFHLFTDLLHLNLSHNSFSSQLPASIFTLTRLLTLDVSRNNFSGEFPTGISNLTRLETLDAFSNSFSGPLPTEISKIESLKVLNFAGSYFSGSIPVEYAFFKSIEFLHLAGNYLSGNLPVELGKLKTVSHIEIGYNLYQGEIPWQFGNLTDLKYLDIADANLSGPIPVQLSNLTKLESLFLFRNQLSGEIPIEFGNMFSLKSLDLSDNLISGPIPETFSKLENLKLLSLMYNDMSGPVPQGIASLKELDTLLIWNNYFTGSLPQDLGKHSKLKHLDVSTNYLVGSIPPGICDGGELVKLILFSNNFTGGLHPSLSNCSSLVRVRLEDNSFSGEISLRFGDSSGLTYVDLSRNRFVGGIPDGIGEASSLEYFNVSDNVGLGGVVPKNIWSLDNLRNFSMNSCGLSGSIPEFGSCKTLSVLELRSNNLSGSIPGSVSKCKKLERIDFAENNLGGLIPVELAEIPVITVLDVSHNGLWGRIPTEFGTSSSLKLLNVSYNDISGLIPPEKVFIMMDKSAFLGNPKLCGAPYRSCHRGISNGLELGSRRAQNVAWVLILCAFIVLFIVAALFGILHFRGGNRGRWKIIAFDGMPQFKEKDILKSSGCVERGNIVLPAGITVSVKKIEWEPRSVKLAVRQLTLLGNARHKSLTRLLGVLYNKNVAYLLYDNLPDGNLAEQIGEKSWEIKRKIVVGVARGLCFLHHDCSPAISHGNLKASNVLLDENMEPHLSEFGLSSIVHSISRPQLSLVTTKETGGFSASIREELHKDVYDFGGLILEVLTNGRLANAQNMPRDVLVREVAEENGIVPSHLSGSELHSFLDVALLCRRSGPLIQDVVKLLSDLKP